MTHKQKVLALLSDGKPHSHMELYRLGTVAHSRVSDLRRDGHRIVAWREGDLYLYQLAGSLDGAAEPSPGGRLRERGSTPSAAPSSDPDLLPSPGSGPLTLFEVTA